MTPLSKLVWFADHDPGTRAAARWRVGRKDFLVLWLTGTVAAVAPGGDGLVMLPFPLPERAPSRDSGLAGACPGVRHDHSRGPLLRASMEGMCLRMRLILDRLDKVYPISALPAARFAPRCGVNPWPR